MNIGTYVEEPVLAVYDEDCNGEAKEYIYASDLKKSEVGTKFSTSAGTCCGRARNTLTATVVYKDEHGVAVVIHHYGTTDSPDPQDWENEPELVWFELH